LPTASSPDPVETEAGSNSVVEKSMSSQGNSAILAKEKFQANLPARIPQLDGLRGIAIGLVLIFHFFLTPLVYVPGSLIAYALIPSRLAWTGVDLFFVLSGFLIGGILLDAREATNYFQVFYIRRFFRIVPIYFLCFGGIYILNLFFGNASNKNFSWLFEDHLPWATFPFFIQNFWMAARNSLGSFGLGATWSLTVEEQFYLTLPVLARVLNRRRLTFVVICGILVAPAIRLTFHALWPEKFFSWFVIMPCRADALFLGVLAAIAVRDQHWKNRLLAHRRSFHVLTPVLLLGLALLTLRGSAIWSFAMLSFGFTWVAISYVSLLLYAVLFPHSFVGRALCTGWLRWMGAIAYGTYLFHEFVYGAIYWSLHSRPPKIANWQDVLVSALALATSLFICRILWLKFEKPLIAIGHRYHFSPRSGSPILEEVAVKP
jgi:peptidoglycan/LPS O-acetylase OafA/YrhL